MSWWSDRRSKTGARLMSLPGAALWELGVGAVGLAVFVAVIVWDVREGRNDHSFLDVLAFFPIIILSKARYGSVVFEKGLLIAKAWSRPFVPWDFVDSYFWMSDRRLVVSLNQMGPRHSAKIHVWPWQREKLNQVLVRYLPGKETKFSPS
jgi:hypothetical protein